MYLKRLDVQGFKSFANKTTLQFATGVTCVVGPNGTGKTNVADSLRWVLGEHHARMLRARKTEDVIFAGSDKRAPMGVAEVSITLDNSGQWLPIDFDEVVVTRRAYRSGENEYLINNAKVRLRDVIDLFMRAQVGQNSYAFMGQGMVEQVLSLRPEDRRGLIEEAADVRLHRNKLEDAHNKLKATRENIDRVRMLVREIEPRMNQLERQAGRAVKYQELAQELAATLHVWYSHQWQEVNAALLAAVAAQDQRAEDHRRVTEALQACDEGLIQLRAAIGERRGEIARREDQVRGLENYTRDLERRAALDAERERMVVARIDELAAEIEALRADEAAQDASAPIRDTSEIERALGAAREELAAHRARLTQVERDLTDSRRTALAEEHAAARALAAVEDLGRRIMDAADGAARLRRAADASIAERRKTISELAAWAREFAGVSKELSLVGPRLDWAIGDRDRETSAVEEARREEDAISEELRGLRAELDAARVRLEVAEQVDVRPQAPDAGVRAILEAGGVIKRETVAEDVELRGIVGLVGQVLRVPPGLEKAIEAALADNLFAIIVERETDMKRAVDLLLAGDAGRATIYALDSFQEMRPLHLIKERGVLGVASGLVRCDSRYRRLIDSLLGRTVVVEDLALAQRVVRRGLAGAVATTSGVLLRPVGSVAAGSLATIDASFARAREIADLPEEIARLEPLIAAREAALRDATARRSEAGRHSKELAATVEQLRDEKARLDTAMATSHASLVGLRTRLQAFHAAARQRDEQIEKLRLARDGAAAEREERAAEARSAGEREQSARAAIAELETQRAALNDTVSEQAAVVARLDGEYRSERHVTDAERQARERLVRQVGQKDEQRSAAQSEAQAISGRLAGTKRELAEKSAELTALRDDLVPAREELAQFESRERELVAQQAESNERVRSAERALYDSENDVRARRDERDALRQSLEAEGFVATDDGEIERAPEPEPEPEFEPSEEYSEAEEGAPPRWLRSEDGDDGLPPIRGGAAVNPVEVRDRIADLRARIRALGPVNEEAADEYVESRERFDFLSGQLGDLARAEEQLGEAIAELETVIRERFRSTFKQVNQEFERYFSAFFRGGTARLELGETDDYGLPGIEIVAQPPGKKLGSLALLSGGERSLTAVALLFALLQANPSPICVLDEVDAALDEANVGRFVEELRALAQRTQFIIITHNRRTIETADTIYGVSMGADNVSRVLSLHLADVSKDLLE